MWSPPWRTDLNNPSGRTLPNSEPASKREPFDYSNRLQTVSNPKVRIIAMDYSQVKNEKISGSYEFETSLQKTALKVQPLSLPMLKPKALVYCDHSFLLNSIKA